MHSQLIKQEMAGASEGLGLPSSAKHLYDGVNYALVSRGGKRSTGIGPSAVLPHLDYIHVEVLYGGRWASLARPGALLFAQAMYTQ